MHGNAYGFGQLRMHPAVVRVPLSEPAVHDPRGKAFWTAPITGTDSRGGTLLHEMSHFTVVAGTDDWAYGQTAAGALAGSDPARAVDNADSHEYFGENSPNRNLRRR